MSGTHFLKADWDDELIYNVLLSGELSESSFCLNRTVLFLHHIQYNNSAKDSNMLNVTMETRKKEIYTHIRPCTTLDEQTGLQWKVKENLLLGQTPLN